jgi:hypothetical protein
MGTPIVSWEGLPAVLRAFPFLLIIVIGLLAACNNGSDPSAEEAPTMVRQQPGVVQNDAQQDEEPEYDPGPYFTPRRESPSDPATFAPAEQIGDFRRIQLRGTCLRAMGQQSQYINSENQVVHLSCRFMLKSEDAQNAIQQIVTNNGLTGEPILMKIQGDESFLLGPSGEGFTYAWNHGQWLFVARSPSGRSPLDSFMEALPF